MRIAVAAFALLALAACGESPTGDDYARMSITIVGGDGQRDTIQGTLDDPLEVQVRDADGRPLEGIIVKFTVRQPDLCGGSAFGTRVATAADGRAAVGWTLGHILGNCQMDAEALHPGHGGVVTAARFTATVLHGEMHSLISNGGEGAFPFASRLRPADRLLNEITSFRLEAPAGAPIQVAGATEGTAQARTLVRLDSAAWARTRPFGRYEYEGDDPYPNAHVRLRLYVEGHLSSSIVCAAQGRNGPAGRQDETHPGRIALRIAPGSVPGGDDPCERVNWSIPD